MRIRTNKIRVIESGDSKRTTRETSRYNIKIYDEEFDPGSG